MSAHITVLASQKGGTAKTTTAAALFSGLTRKGYKVLAVDTDAQRNLSFTMNADETKPSVYEMLKGTVPPLEAIQHTAQGDLIAASGDLAGADMEFSRHEYILHETLSSLREHYDFIIIDTPPALGSITIAALTAANDVVIPLGADVFSLQGLSQISETIAMIKELTINKSLTVAGLLITRYSGRGLLRQELRDAIGEAAARINTKAFDAIIREGIAIIEAQAQQESIYIAAPKSNAATDYAAFVDEFLRGLNL
jgi:chromosome partitioning protein